MKLQHYFVFLILPNSFTLLIPICYLLFPVLIMYFIQKWVNQFISLRQEQNTLLREILKKLENK
jgi:hypothetical protein